MYYVNYFSCRWLIYCRGVIIDLFCDAVPDSGPQRQEGNQKEDELNFNLKNFRFKRIANIIKKRMQLPLCWKNSVFNTCLLFELFQLSVEELKKYGKQRSISVSLQIGCLLFWSVKKALQLLLSSVPVTDLYLLLWEMATNCGQNRDTVLNCLKLKLFVFAIIIRTM